MDIEIAAIIWLTVICATISWLYQRKLGVLKEKINWDKFQHLANVQGYQDQQMLYKQEIQASQEVIASLKSRSKYFMVRVDRLNRIVKDLRARQITYTVSLTKDKTPDMDIRVNQYQAREELALELQKQGVITYTISDKYRPDIDLTEVTVSASINTLKLR